MFFCDRSVGGSSGEDGEGGSDSFATALTNVFHVGFNSWVKGVHLLADHFLDLFDVRTNEFKGEEFRIYGFSVQAHC